MYQKEFTEYQVTDVVTKLRIELQKFHGAGLKPAPTPVLYLLSF